MCWHQLVILLNIITITLKIHPIYRGHPYVSETSLGILGTLTFLLPASGHDSYWIPSSVMCYHFPLRLSPCLPQTPPAQRFGWNQLLGPGQQSPAISQGYPCPQPDQDPLPSCCPSCYKSKASHSRLIAPSSSISSPLRNLRHPTC